MNKNWLLPAVMSVLAMTAIFAAYSPGLTGALYYDDYGNLEGLASVHNIEDAWHFARNGVAGPLGRPLAYASFLPHAGGWPNNSTDILRVNVLIHVANGFLLGLLGYLILRLRNPGNRSRAFKIAFGAAFLWASLPMLASANLIAIQRMTGLAAFFGLLGLVGFVAGYFLQARRPWRAIVLQLAALGAGTLLAMLSKENGALIPVFALLIDALLLRHLHGNTLSSQLRRGLLVLGLVTILFYLSPLYRDWFSVITHRGFSPWERLQTQIVLLWEYLRLSFMPLPSAFSPFHDDRGIDYTGWASLLSFAAWLGAIGLGLWLAIWRRVVWPLFAALWFLTGHLLESTTIGLEIYFEHRNYLALYGCCLALAVGAFSLPGKLEHLAPAFLGIYAAVQLTALVALTSIWGQPLIAAEMWTNTHPASGRAVIHQIFLEAEIHKEDAAEDNAPSVRQRRQVALQRLDRTIEACPACLDVHLEALRYSCDLTSAADTRHRLSGAVEAAYHGKGARTTIELLFRLRDRVNADQCPPLNRSDLLAITDGLMENPLFAISHFSGRILFIAAALADDAGHTNRRNAYLARAEAVEPRALPVLQFQVYSALSEHDHEEALAAIERRRSLTGTKGAMSDSVLKRLRDEVEEARTREMNEAKLIGTGDEEPGYTTKGRTP